MPLRVLGSLVVGVSGLGPAGEPPKKLGRCKKFLKLNGRPGTVGNGAIALEVSIGV
jgi:hypothetical protein